MFNIFKKQMTIKDTEDAFQVWQRALRVDLFTKFTEWNSAKGLLGEKGKDVAAQEVNYICDENWEKNIQTFPDEIKKMITENKTSIVTLLMEAIKEDKMCREVVVNYLRIKSVILFNILGDEFMESEAKKRMEGILSVYGSEFPEEADPIKFDKLLLEFHRTIFPQ